MNRGFSSLLLCSVLVLATGCGSSGTSGSASNAVTGSTATSTSPATSTPGATSGSAPPGTTSPGAASGGLKLSKTPRYASPASSAPVQSGVIQVAYRNITIDPDTLKVKVGSTIRWTNYDSIEHNVTSTGGPTHFSSKNFGEGKSFEVRLTKPGVTHYLCTIHPTSMNGTIEVVK
jgi:plastocyanin